MRISLCTLMGMVGYDNDGPAKKALRQWVKMSSKRPYDKEIITLWLPDSGRFIVEYI